MKKLVCFVLIYAVILSIALFGVTATQIDFEDWLPGTPYMKGDVNVDNTTDITDATALQLHIAGLAPLCKIGLQLADVDIDKDVTIMDATAIQQYEAKIIDSFEFENDPDVEAGFCYIEITDVGYVPEVLKKGESIDIALQYKIHSKHYTIDTSKMEYRYKLQHADEAETYFFEFSGNETINLTEIGNYRLTVEVSDNWGDYTRCTYDFEVVE